MRIALMSDIHSNREAFSACLAHARDSGVVRHVFLGDYVGYGADPEWVVATIAALVDGGAIAIAGNHDRAVADGSGGMNANAAWAIDWTRGRLDSDSCAFLSTLPLCAEEEDRLYVHADASAPGRWRYVEDAAAAASSLAATSRRLTFCGHVHVPAIYGEAASEHMYPDGGVLVPLAPTRRWLAVVGSVGQPRDRNPAAAYSIYDTATSEIACMRVPYDVATAAAKIRAAGLPEILAARLSQGR